MSYLDRATSAELHSTQELLKRAARAIEQATLKKCTPAEAKNWRYYQSLERRPIQYGLGGKRNRRRRRRNGNQLSGGSTGTSPPSAHSIYAK